MLYSDVVNSITAGATAGSFDAVGTITLRSDATYLYGFWVSAVPTAQAAAVAATGVVKINSSDLGIGDQTFSCPPYAGGHPGTNIGQSIAEAEFIPMFTPVSGKVTVNVSYSQNAPSNGVACAVVVGAVYEAGKGTIPADIKATWPYMAPVSKGAVTQSKASITALGATAIGTVTIPGWVKEIIGFKQFLMPNLMTQNEYINGWVEYTSTIPDFAPQKWPLAFAQYPPLGTPVGIGAVAQAPFPAMAAYFQKSQQNESITANVNLVKAITTGDPVISTVYYR